MVYEGVDCSILHIDLSRKWLMIMYVTVNLTAEMLPFQIVREEFQELTDSADFLDSFLTVKQRS